MYFFLNTRDYLITYSCDKLKLWSPFLAIDSHSLLKIAECEKFNSFLDINPEIFVTKCSGSKIMLWDYSTFTCLQVIKLKFYFDLASSYDRYLICISRDRDLNILFYVFSLENNHLKLIEKIKNQNERNIYQLNKFDLLSNGNLAIYFTDKQCHACPTRIYSIDIKYK